MQLLGASVVLAANTPSGRRGTHLSCVMSCVQKKKNSKEKMTPKWPLPSASTLGRLATISQIPAEWKQGLL